MITIQDDQTGFTASFHNDGLTIIAPGNAEKEEARTLNLTIDEAICLIAQVGMFQRMANPTEQFVDSFKWQFNRPDEQPF
jgi:hypothetical protein